MRSWWRQAATVTAPDGGALAYGRGEGFRVPGFVAWGDPRRQLAA